MSAVGYRTGRLIGVITLIITYNMIFAAEPDVRPMIKAWKTTGPTQTLKAQFYNDILTTKKDTALFYATINALESYLGNRPDLRVNVRYHMYKILGYWLFKLKTKEENKKLILNVIRLAEPLNDNQLKAELFALYGDNCEDNFEGIYYNLHALEMQKKIGLEYFPFVLNRYFFASVALYDALDFQNSIRFGKEFLNYKDTVGRRWNPHVYILQLDILGAAYRKLGNWDSCAYYYNILLDKVPEYLEDKDSLLQYLWKGIADGNLGFVLIKKKRFNEALPLLQSYLKNSYLSRDSLNIAIAQKFLGDYYYDTGAIQESLIARHTALAISNKLKSAEQHKSEALYGLSEIYRKLHVMDSAFYYNELYHQVQNKLNETHNNLKYTALTSKLEYDNLQNSLALSSLKMARIKMARNFIIAIISMAALMIVLFFRRKAIINEYKVESLRLQQEVAENEVNNAYKQLENFKQNIREKNILIETLNRRVSPDFAEIQKNLLDNALLTNDQWKAFRKEFDKAYPLFFPLLNENLSTRTTPAEERLAALVFLKLNNDEIGNTLGISKESVSRSKRRLRALFVNTKEDTLEEIIFSLCEIKEDG